MKNCYVCGQEAQFYHDGVWWCEEHRGYSKKKAESRKEMYERSEEKSNEKTPLKLGLHWL